MTDYADLEKRLRRRATDRRFGVPNVDLRVKPTTVLLIEAADALASLTRKLEEAREQRDEAYEDAAGIAEEGAYYGGNRTDAEGLARDIASAIKHKGRDLRAQDEAHLSRDNQDRDTSTENDAG